MIYHGAGCLIPLNSSTSWAGPHYRVPQRGLGASLRDHWKPCNTRWVGFRPLDGGWQLKSLPTPPPNGWVNELCVGDEMVETMTIEWAALMVRHHILLYASVLLDYFFCLSTWPYKRWVIKHHLFLMGQIFWIPQFQPRSWSCFVYVLNRLIS